MFNFVGTHVNMILDIHIAPMDSKIFRDAVVHSDRLSGMTVSGNFHLRLVVPKTWMRTVLKLCVVLIEFVGYIPYIIL